MSTPRRHAPVAPRLDDRTGHRGAAARLASLLEGAAAALALALVAAGVLLLALPRPPIAAALHARAADALVGVALMALVAAYASGLHRVDARRWAALVALFAAASALHALGGAAGAGEAGQEGRAHVAEALGVVPSRGAVIAAHALAGSALAVAAVALAASRLRAAGRARAARDLLVGGALALALVAGLAALAPPLGGLPPLDGVAAAAPPWPAAPLAPLESAWGLRAALGVAGLALGALLALPWVDAPHRAPWVRRATSAAGAAALALFLVSVAVGGPSFGAHAGAPGGSLP